MMILEILILSFLIISTTLLSLVLLAYIKFKVLIMHPNQLYLIIIILQIVLNLIIISVTLVEGELPSYFHFRGSNFMMYFRYFVSFLMILEIHYNLVINFEVFLKLKQKLNLKYGLRMFCLNIYAWTISALLTILSSQTADNLLNFYSIGRMIYEIYMLTLVIFLIIISLIFHIRYRYEIKSSQMNVLLLLCLVDTLILGIKVVFALFWEEKILDLKTEDYIAFMIQSIEGILEFSILMFSEKTKKLISRLLLCDFNQEDIKTDPFSNITLSPKDSLIDLRFPLNKSGFLSDIFESTDKNVTLN